MSKIEEPNPTEDKIQKDVIKYLQLRYPRVRFFHVPNEGYRADKYAYKLKAMGTSAGVPDIVIPYPNRFYHGLYIELKRRKGYTISDHQRDWCDYLNSVGYKAVICKGYDSAIQTIDEYMKETKDGK